MPMSSLIEENIARLNKKAADAAAELERVKNTTEQEMWLAELDTLDAELTKFYKAKADEQTDTDDSNGEKPKKKPVIRKKKVDAAEPPIKMKVKKTKATPDEL
jgi:hypothetical protein